MSQDITLFYHHHHHQQHCGYQSADITRLMTVSRPLTCQRVQPLTAVMLSISITPSIRHTKTCCSNLQTWDVGRIWPTCAKHRIPAWLTYTDIRSSSDTDNTTTFSESMAETDLFSESVVLNKLLKYSLINRMDRTEFILTYFFHVLRL